MSDVHNDITKLLLPDMPTEESVTFVERMRWDNNGVWLITPSTATGVHVGFGTSAPDSLPINNSGKLSVLAGEAVPSWNITNTTAGNLGFFTSGHLTMTFPPVL